MKRERLPGDRQIGHLQQGNHLSSGSSGSESSNDRTLSHSVLEHVPGKPTATEELSTAQRNSLEHQNSYLLPGKCLFFSLFDFVLFAGQARCLELLPADAALCGHSD